MSSTPRHTPGPWVVLRGTVRSSLGDVALVAPTARQQADGLVIGAAPSLYETALRMAHLYDALETASSEEEEESIHLAIDSCVDSLTSLALATQHTMGAFCPQTEGVCHG